MKRSNFFAAGMLVLVMVGSIFTLTPFTRTVHADETASCDGLFMAVVKCTSRNPQGNCDRIIELYLERCVAP